MYACGVPEGDLVRLKGGAPLPLRALLQERPASVPPERWTRLQEFARRFSRWRELSGYVPTGDLVETILEETRFADRQQIDAVALQTPATHGDRFKGRFDDR